MSKKISNVEVRFHHLTANNVIATSAPKLSVNNDGFQGWGDVQSRGYYDEEDY